MKPTRVSPIVVDTTRSAHAVLRPTPIHAVRLAGSFWQPYQQINRTVMLPAQYRLCEETGRLDNFRRAAGKLPGQFTGVYFNDSDVYKWLEAAAWVLASEEDAQLRALVERTIDEVAAAQLPDGYLDTYFMGVRAAQRWTDFSLHEMYCAGHLFQAAVACLRGFGNSRLMAVAVKLANHLCDRFGPEEQGKHFGLDGHPEVEMALVELYRATGEQKFMDLARYFVDARGYGRLSNLSLERGVSYYQDRVPFRQMKRLEGHSVRAVYLNCGGADLFAETGEAALKTALEAMWASMTARQMYLTGGLGSRYETEGFGPDYELPNGRAHTETCAAVGSFMWNWRMLLISGEARYADLMEWVLYNGILPGVSLDGTAYFYQNPLSDDGNHRREQWFVVACCPSNISRLLATLPGYVYTTSPAGLWVHLYTNSQSTLTLQGGQTIQIQQQTDYPWSGTVRLEIETAGTFSLFLRKPAWCAEAARLSVNGQAVEAQTTPGGYLQVARDWQAGDVLTLDLPMLVRRLESHPAVVENQGRAALARGPLVYCLEAVDHPGSDVRFLALPAGAELNARLHPELLGGVVALHGQCRVIADAQGWEDTLYRPLAPAAARPPAHAAMTAIPYYAWANREPGPMQVWLPVI